MRTSHPLSAFSVALTFALIFSAGCVKKAEQNSSSHPTGTNLEQSRVKHQSIGNCWAYSGIAWAESLVMKASKDKTLRDFSEPYLSYLDFEDKLLNYEDELPKTISEGGSWGRAAAFLLKGGLLNEEDFSLMAKEQNGDFKILEKAVEEINKSLTDKARLGGGRQADDEAWRALVRTELDKAFEVKIDEVKKLAKPLSDFVLSDSPNGKKHTLKEEIGNWGEIGWQRGLVTPEFSEVPLRQSQASDDVQNVHLRKAIKALNRGLPVILDWFLDLRGRGKDSSFNAENLAAGTIINKPRHFGWHSTVIEDYVAYGADESSGDEFIFGEGNPVGSAEEAKEQRRLSENFGELKYFLIKNSWGGEDFSRSYRDQEFSYIRDMSTGYNRMYASYMRSWVSNDDKPEDKKMTSGASALIMPREL